MCAPISFTEGKSSDISPPQATQIRRGPYEAKFDEFQNVVSRFQRINCRVDILRIQNEFFCESIDRMEHLIYEVKPSGDRRRRLIKRFMSWLTANQVTLTFDQRMNETRERTQELVDLIENEADQEKTVREAIQLISFNIERLKAEIRRLAFIEEGCARNLNVYREEFEPLFAILSSQSSQQYN